MQIMNRIARLERHHHIRLVDRWRCPKCGHGRRPAPNTKFVVTFGHDDAKQTHCPECGRQLVYRLEFDDRG